MVICRGRRYSAEAILREGVWEGGNFEFRRILKIYRTRHFMIVLAECVVALPDSVCRAKKLLLHQAFSGKL